MARIAPQWIFKKGGEAWSIAEQFRVSPMPKLGGWAGKQLRLLSVSRGQSVITDIEQGSLAVKQRHAGLPSMQQMWFHPQGFSLGYNKRRASDDAAELFFFDPQAHLWKQQLLPAAAIEASAGTDQWFIACRNGRVYAFSLEGWPLWSELIPNARRDNATNELWGLPVFHPRLHLASDGGVLAIGAEQELHRYHTSGQRLWGEVLPEPESCNGETLSTDLPTRGQRLRTLGMQSDGNREQVRTGYLRLKLDTLLNAGWLKQVEVSDIDQDSDAQGTSAGAAVQVALGLTFKPGISVLRSSVDAIIAGTQDGFVHVFDREGSLRRTFQVGDAAVSDLLVMGGGPKAAYCGGRLTLFERGGVSGTVELPEAFADLTGCGDHVLAWRSNSLWLVEPTGKVRLAVETDRQIRGVWGNGAGFCALAGELTSFQPCTSGCNR